MAQYVLNKNQQPNGDFEVHNQTDGCGWLPAPESQVPLGTHHTCHSAITAAKAQLPQYSRVNGCVHCSPACHTT